MSDRRDEPEGSAPKRPKPAGDSPYAPPPVPLAPPPLEPVASTLARLPHLADGPAWAATGRVLPFEDADVSFKLCVHHDVVAVLLGVDGAILTTIREHTGCRVKVIDGGGGRMMLQMGGAAEQACMAAGLVLSEMQQSCSSNPAVCSVESFRGENMPTYTIQMRVRADACGCIIGKGGAAITQLRQTSNAHVKLETTEAASATSEREITIVGPINNVHTAVLDIINRIAGFIRQQKAKSAESTSIHSAVDPSNAPTIGAAAAVAGKHPLEQGAGYEHLVPAEIVGRIIGPGGSQIREIRDRSGARVRVSNEKEPGTELRKLTIWGTETQVHVVLTMIGEITSRADDRPGRSKPSSVPPYPPSAYGASPYAPAYGAPPGYAPPPSTYAYPPPTGYPPDPSYVYPPAGVSYAPPPPAYTYPPPPAAPPALYAAAPPQPSPSYPATSTSPSYDAFQAYYGLKNTKAAPAPEYEAYAPPPTGLPDPVAGGYALPPIYPPRPGY
mmetsp:Transcript_16165/g.34199  ORF Transcript_16165/g.34199 Transcript_16165/m.34199 type:complete len:499 (+) Transcript_16165:95-1591(+)